MFREIVLSFQETEESPNKRATREVHILNTASHMKHSKKNVSELSYNTVNLEITELQQVLNVLDLD